MNKHRKHRARLLPGLRPANVLLGILAVLAFALAPSAASADPVPVPAPTFHDNGDVSPSDQEPHPELTYGFDGDFVFVTHGPECADSINKIVFVTVGDLGEGNEPSYLVSEGGSEFLTLAELKDVKRLDLKGLDLDGYTGGWYRIYPVGSDTCGERPPVPVDEEPTPQVLPSVGAKADAMAGMVYGGVVLLAGAAIVAGTRRQPRHRRP